jgi:hypothetical protein
MTAARRASTGAAHGARRHHNRIPACPPPPDDRLAAGSVKDALRRRLTPGPIRLSVAETARLARLAADWAAGLLTPAHLTFRLRWSARRRRHQAAARWRHYAARLAAAT